MLIFLTGFMGSGKSRKGRELAAALNCPFIDTDDVVVSKIGMSINEYFQVYGELQFRAQESEVLRSTEYPPSCVVAVGGGLPCFNENMHWMNEKGITIYLQMTPPALVSRLRNRDKRPLIKDFNDKRLLEFIELKLEERSQFYLEAQIIVDGLHATASSLSTVLAKRND